MAAPPIPTGLVATGTTATTVTLDWDDSTGASSYKIFRNGVQVGTSGTSIFTITGLTPATAYTFTVSALNSDPTPESNHSVGLTVTTSETPAGPGNLRVTKITSDSISLSWNAIDGALTYTVYRDDEAVGEDLTATSFTDTGLEMSTTYTYFVTATTSAGESAESAEITVTTFGDGTGKEAAWAKRFRQVDIDANGLLTLEEYLNGQFARQAKVIGIHRFEYMDTDDSGDVNLTEYAKGLGGRKFFSPTRTRQFYLADRYFLAEGEEPDGYLDEFEFALTVNSKIKVPKLLNMLDKRDDNNSGDLSEVEFGIRNGSDLDSGEPLPET